MSETITPVPTLQPTIRERIERGIAWLDQTVPAWRDAIHRRALDLSDSNDCVLGQVFYAEAARVNDRDGFNYAMKTYVSDDYAAQSAWVIGHGFEADGESYDVLTVAWLHLLEA